MKRKPIALAVSGCIGMYLVSQAALAADLTMPALVIEAGRIQQPLNDVSRPVAVVEREQIETLQPGSVAQALVGIPNVQAAGGPREGNKTVNIRGMTENKVLQVVDGVRQTFESGHRPSYFLDPELIQRIEVIKGPVSSLWGSGALGGVVAQNTVSAADLLKPGQTVGGFVKSGYNANNFGTTNTVALAGLHEQLDWMVSGYYRDSEDLKQGNGERLAQSGRQDAGVMTNLNWQLSDEQSLGLQYRTAEADGGVPSNGAAAPSTSNPLLDRHVRTENLALEYALDSASPYVDAKVKGYWNQVEMEESRQSDGRQDATQLDVYGLSVNNVSRFDAVTVLYGVDAYQEQFSANRAGSNRPLPPDAESNVWGAFVQTVVPVTSVVSLELGGRYDHFSTQADNLSQSRSDQQFSPSAAINWQAAESLSLTLRHDYAFRAPSSEELYTTGTHFCMGPFACNVFVSNPDLKPETSRNTELMAKWSVSDLAGGDHLQLNASVFHNEVDDFIEQVVSMSPFPGTTTWRNVDKARITGAELSADYRYNRLRWQWSYGHARGEDRNTGQDLSQIPADTFATDLSYAVLPAELTLGTRVTRALSQKRTQCTGCNGDTYDGYTLVDLYASWEPKSLPGMKLDLAINNLTDQDYQVAWESLKEAGREVKLSARYRF